MNQPDPMMMQPVKPVNEAKKQAAELGRDLFSMPAPAKAEPVLAAEPRVEQPVHFDGRTYRPEHDQARLKSIYMRVHELMLDGNWWTRRGMEKALGLTWAQIGPRLRDQRKRRFGGYEVDRERINNPEDGEFRYRLVRETSAAA